MRAWRLVTGPLLLLLAAPGGRPTLVAQQFSVGPSDGVVIPLPGGRIAILQTIEGSVVVHGLVDGPADSSAALDIAIGDRVTRFQTLRNPPLDSIRAGFRAIAAGAEVMLGLVRGAAAERVVTFPNLAPGNRQVMAVSGGGAGAGAWVTGGAPSEVQEIVIAGAHIRNNAQGMPAVTHRSAHAAASTVALRVGDVITAVNGRPIAALAGLELLLGRAAVGEEVTLTVTRANATVSIRFPKPAS